MEAVGIEYIKQVVDIARLRLATDLILPKYYPLWLFCYDCIPDGAIKL